MQSASAQPIADTLDWRRYFPLEVGNQWQYRSEDFGYVYFTRWHIRGDTLIESQSYFIIEIEGYNEDLRPLDQLQRSDVIRYDTTNGLILKLAVDQDGSPVEIWWLDIPCGLNAPFNARNDCTGTLTGMDYFVDGVYDASYHIGTDTVETEALKFFDSLGGGWTLASDIGLVGSVVEGGSPVTKLVYAHLEGRTYGEAAVPTTSEELPEITPKLTISSAFPNPFTTFATVHYNVLEPGLLSVEVYDMLGRRVRRYTEEPGAPGPYQTVIDGKTLSTGSYVVRLIGPSGEQATSIIIRVK